MNRGSGAGERCRLVVKLGGGGSACRWWLGEETPQDPGISSKRSNPKLPLFGGLYPGTFTWVSAREAQNDSTCAWMADLCSKSKNTEESSFVVARLELWH